MGSIGRNTNASAIKTIQDQIRDEERRQQALQAQQHQHQPPQPAQEHHQSAQEPPHLYGGSVLGYDIFHICCSGGLN